jgi:multidrug efflux pump subunit AcrA (membrane-fusion protein)
VLTLGSRGRGEVVQVAVADRDVLALHLGDPAVVRFHALGERRLTGEVSRIGAAADRMTGTYLVEITVHGGSALVSGMVGEGELRPRRGVPTKLVPLEAVLEADGPTGTVYALSSDGRRAERRRIRVGFIDGGRVAVTQGLENVARVVTSGASYLGGDSNVRVTP